MAAQLTNGGATAVFPAHTDQPIPLFQVRSTLGILIIILAVGAGLRIYALVDRPLGFDEAYSWRLARSPAGTLGTALEVNSSPPLYWILLRGWVRVFGDTTVAVRGLSVLAGTVTLVGMFLFARQAALGLTCACPRSTELVAVRAGLLAATLLAVSPFHIRYSVEAQMYAVGAALAVFSSWLLMRAMIEGARPDRWLGYMAVTAAFAYTHYFALLTIACQAGFVIWLMCERQSGRWWAVYRDPQFRLAAAGFGAVGLALAPWSPVLFEQLRQGQVQEWLHPLTSSWQIPGSIYRLIVNPEQLDVSRIAMVRAVALVSGFLAVVVTHGRAGDWLVVVLGVGPILLVAAVGAVGAVGLQLAHDRYLAFAQPFLLAAVALAAVRARPPAWAALVAVGVVTASGWACADAWDQASWRGKSGCRGAAEFIASQRQPGEPIVVANGFAYLSFHYHSPDRADLYVFAATPGMSQVGQGVMTDAEIVAPDAFARWIAHRVWVVNLLTAGAPVTHVPVPPEWVSAERVTFPSPQFGEVEVVRYDPVPNDRPGKR